MNSQNPNQISQNSSYCIIQHKNMYAKYSSSQTYFYTNKINEIVREKRTNTNIVYEDIEYICDNQEYLKRWYSYRQYQQKMFTFKEYYFYHQDCPRIFMKYIDDLYTKWQDKKRDLIYKKLKLIYNQNYNSDQQSNSDKSTRNQPPVSHFLNEISQFNPFSKNYYLRVQARKEKQQALRKQEAKKNRSKFQLSNLQHELSQMLGNLNDLSQISTLLDMEDTPKKGTLYQTYTRKGILAQKDGSNQMSTNSKSNSSIKFNFKKKSTDTGQNNQKLIARRKSIYKKQSKEGPHLPKATIQNTKKEIRKNMDIKLQHEIQLNKQQNFLNNSPKLSNQDHNLKSVFSVSSFGALNNTNYKLNNKRQTLKLQYNNNNNNKNPQLYQTTADKNNAANAQKKQYESQQSVNLIIKSKSTSKVTLQKPTLSKIRVRQITVGKPLLKIDQFSDKKFQEFNKFRSHKSQYSSSSSFKKPLFRISNQEPILNFKRTLQLKNF